MYRHERTKGSATRSRRDESDYRSSKRRRVSGGDSDVYKTAARINIMLGGCDYATSEESVRRTLEISQPAEGVSDFGSVYAQILETCRPFYDGAPPSASSALTASSVRVATSSLPSGYGIPARLEDGFENLSTPERVSAPERVSTPEYVSPPLVAPSARRIDTWAELSTTYNLEDPRTYSREGGLKKDASVVADEDAIVSTVVCDGSGTSSPITDSDSDEVVVPIIKRPAAIRPAAFRPSDLAALDKLAPAMTCGPLKGRNGALHDGVCPPIRSVSPD